MNALLTHMTRKSLIVITVAVTLGIAAGASILYSTGDVTAAEGLTPGFIKGGTPVKPDPAMIEAGKKIYFRKCVWCHGVHGGGDGPGADRLWPRPRNFNQGTFKIRHTASGELPLFDPTKPVAGQNDLFDTVTHGLPGSAMPPWDGILTEQQRLQVLSFVTTQLVKDRKFDDKTETFSILDVQNKSAIKQVSYAKESIEKGRQLIVDKKCVECHGNEGRGDANPFNPKDAWGVPIQPAN